MKTIADIPLAASDHLNIIVSDSRLYECSLVRTRRGIWMVAENGVNLLTTQSESDAVTRFLQILSDKEKADGD